MKSLKFYKRDLEIIFFKKLCPVWQNAFETTFNGSDFFCVNRTNLRLLDKTLRNNIKNDPSLGGYEEIDHKKPYKLLESYMYMARLPISTIRGKGSYESYILACAKDLTTKLRAKDE